MGKNSTSNVNAIVGTVISVSLNILFIAIVVMCMVTFGGRAYEFGNRVFDESAVEEAPGTDVSVVIPKDASVSDIAKILYNAGLVKDKNAFFVQLYLSDNKDDVASGAYTLNTAMTPQELIAAMCQTEEETQ